MVPQTHNVSVAVLVPKPDKPQSQVMRLISKTTMIDADRGTSLRPRNSAAVQSELLSLFRRYNYSRRVTDDQQRSLFGYLDKNDYPGFREFLADEFLTITMSEAFWADLASLKNGSQYNSARFVVPTIPVPLTQLPTQSPTLLDDGKATTTAALQGGTSLSANKLRGALVLSGQPPDSKTTLAPITLLATAIDVVDGGRAIQISFPSLTNLKLASDGKLQPRTNATLQLFRLKEDGEQTLLDSLCVYAAKPSNEPSFGMTISSKVINSTEGKGSLNITFTKVKSKVHLTIEGADLPTSLPATLKTDTAGLFVEGDAVLSLELQNLNPIANVVITAKDESGASIQIVRPVLELVKKK